MKLVNAYYVTHTFYNKPFFIGPHATLEQAEKDYSKVKSSDKQIVKIQVVK